MQAAALAPPEHVEPVSFADLKRRVVVPYEDFENFLQKHDWTYHQLARQEYPQGVSSLEEFQLACICADPVLWVQAFLRDPDDPDQPYTFWEYQKESLRYRGDVLHEDGSEVGKSREIHALALYHAFTAYRGSGLVAAPKAIYYVEIIDMIMDQLAINKELGRALKLHRKAPHPHLRFKNGFRLDFRPTDFNGAPLRGVHVSTFAIMDEAAVAKNSKIFDEFWRAGKPGCTFRLYSVPDGDRSCEFYRLCQKADGKLDDDDNRFTKNRAFRKFHWPKTIMPEPYWSAARRRGYIEQFGGEDTAGYKHNVLGLWGDPENSVFPWAQFQRLIKDIPEYRVLKIMADDSQGEVSLLGAKYSAGANDAATGEQIIDDRRIGKSEFDIATEIKAFFSNTPGLKFGGADLGFSQDPTEIYVKLILGKTHRLIARLQLKGVSYDQQADAINALDDVFDGGQNKMGWGVDFGNAGSAVVHVLQNQAQYLPKKYEERLTGYQFGAAYEAVNEAGDELLDKRTRKPYKLLAKELSTDLLVGKMQRQELEYPHDPDLSLYYPNHTYRQGQKHRIYKDVDDHVIDADRVLTLRIVLPGDAGPDLFACGN